MNKLQVHIGLTPEEMMTIFNRMYMEVWNYTKGNINWEEKDLTKLLLQVFEVVITAARDGVMLTLFENNEKLYYDLQKVGINFPPELTRISGVEVEEEKKEGEASTFEVEA